MAERERFELSLELTPYYRFSKPAPSATWVPLHIEVVLQLSFNFSLALDKQAGAFGLTRAAGR